ncbi:MAG TPA: NAD(P)H-hydrate dehydratase [Verrucomicrobiae bacterium]|nr:NAD(P)H-hydrate dehydratase [Verrucomicrobiae bacterium]
MPLPVISVAQMREWEKATWATGQTEGEVIRRVGKKIARRARKLTRSGDVILILAGKGHNGDDARAAAEHLENRRVQVMDVTKPEAALAEFQRRTGVAPASVSSDKNGDRLEAGPTLIIDGLFGIGLNRSLDEAWIKFITAVNDTKIPVLSVDVPSGLNTDTGETFGAAIEAAITLTVGAPKTGMLAPAAWPFVGRLEIVENVGLVPCPLAGEINWTQPSDFDDYPPRRAVAGHKGSFGHLAIVAGSLGFHGAAVLATRAAHRAQPGLVTLFTQENVYHPVAAQLQAAMVQVWQPGLRFPDSVSAVFFGPGLAAPDLPEELKTAFRRLWRDSPLPLVADASALDWLSSQPFPRDAIRVITPHPGEAARLLNSTAQQVQADRPRALRELSRRYGSWVVLKGHQTLIGRADGKILVNPSGNPHLAQGGSGDTLGGFIAGLLAQPALHADVGKIICYAVWQHSAAADALQSKRANWVVEDLVNEIGNAR